MHMLRSIPSTHVDLNHNTNLPNIVTKAERAVKVRLVGNNDLKSTGRLEVLYKGIWGTVCRHHFGQNDAEVVCRQLGFSNALSWNSYHEKGSGQIWLNNVECNGEESSIANCRHDGWGVNNCNHSQDVGITCFDGM